MYIVATNPFIAFLVVAEELGSKQASAIIRLLKTYYKTENLVEIPVLYGVMVERLYRESATESVDLGGYHWQSLNPDLPQGQVTLFSSRYLTIKVGTIGYQFACLEAVYKAGLLCDERNPDHAQLIASHREYYANEEQKWEKIWPK